MAIKNYGVDTSIHKDVQRQVTVGGKTKVVTDTYFRTKFIADETSDITAMNAAGSEYLNYPCGSFALCIADGGVYVMNATETEYMKKGGGEDE